MTIRVAIETHGCKLNQADSDALARCLVRAGYRVVAGHKAAEVHVLNTCTVTHVADAKARHALRAAHRRKPGVSIIAIGCYARRAPQELAEVEGVDLVVDQLQVEQVLEEVTRLADGRENIGPSSQLASSAVRHSAVRTRAMVKIQEGCLRACAYCIVPQVRGRARSVPPDVVLGEVRRRGEEGYREVVLTGTQPGCYGVDIKGASLAALLRGLLSKTRVERIRVSSLQPQELSPGLVELWNDPRLCPHVHMPLQSGSPPVLQRMGRLYAPEEYVKAVEMLRSSVPDIAITTDVMVGFPGETEADFEETFRLCRRLGFSGIHVFPFSPRPGTRATGMERHVPRSDLSTRVNRMLLLAKELESGFRRVSLGQVRPVLWEGTRKVNGRRAWSGLTDNYLRTFTSNAGDLANRITKAQLCEERDGALWAHVVEPAA